jgi:hypothetical protein
MILHRCIDPIRQIYEGNALTALSTLAASTAIAGAHLRREERVANASVAKKADRHADVIIDSLLAFAIGWRRWRTAIISVSNSGSRICC